MTDITTLQPEPTPVSGAALLRGPTGFFPGLAYEWSRIAWPTPLQLLVKTVIVIAMTTMMTLLIWGLDWFWRTAIQWIVPARGL